MKTLKVTFVCFASFLLAYFITGFSLFSQKRSAIVISDDVYLLHLTASLLNQTKQVRLPVSPDDETHAVIHLAQYELAHQRLLTDANGNLVPRWFSPRLDYDDKFQRMSPFHWLYPWMRASNLTAQAK